MYHTHGAALAVATAATLVCILIAAPRLTRRIGS